MKRIMKTVFRSPERDRSADDLRYLKLHQEIEGILGEIQREFDGLNTRIGILSERVVTRDLWGHDAFPNKDGMPAERDCELRKAADRSRMLYKQIGRVSSMLRDLETAREEGLF